MFSIDNFLSFPPPYYSIATILGAIICIITLKFTIKARDNIDKSYCAVTALVGMSSAFFMAHIVYALAQHHKLFYIITHPHLLFQSVPAFLYYFLNIFGGMVFYGGLIGFCLGGFIYLKHEKLNIETYSDIFAPLIPLFHAFGRIGCYLTGCCYGKEIETPLPFSAISTDNGIIHRIPIQLIEAMQNIIIFTILMILLHKCKKLKYGNLILIYGTIYPICRFINEFFRGDYTERGYIGVLSTSQWISILIFTFSIIMLIIKNTNKSLRGCN